MKYYLNSDERLGDIVILNETEIENDLGFDEPFSMLDAINENYDIIVFETWIELARHALTNNINPKKYWKVLKNSPGFPF